MLKSEAHAEAIYDNRALKKYIVRHHHTWHAYVRNDLLQDIKPEDIVVVSGWVKTEADWVVAAFSNASTSSSGPIEAHAGGAAGLKAEGSHMSSVTGPKMHRHGERYLRNASVPSSADAKRDQSIFVRRYKLRRRFIVLRKVVAGAGYHRFPDPGDGRGASGEEGIMEREVEDIDEAGILGLEDEVHIPLGQILNHTS